MNNFARLLTWSKVNIAGALSSYLVGLVEKGGGADGAVSLVNFVIHAQGYMKILHQS